MKNSFLVLAGLLVFGIILPSLVFSSPPPQLTGYDYELDLTNMMANTTPAIQDIPTPTYYHAYHKVLGDTLHLGIVCNGSAPSGTNDYSWCGFGFRVSDNSSTGMVNSDGIIGFVNPDEAGKMYSVDMSLNGRTFGIPTTCKSGTTLVCPDSSRTNIPCADNVLTATGYRQNEYLVLEYTRKLDTGDACDKVIVVDDPVAIVFSIGLVNTLTAWPYGIQKHDYAGNLLTSNYFVTFKQHIAQQTTQQQTTQQQTTQQTTQQQTTQTTQQTTQQQQTTAPQATHKGTKDQGESSTVDDVASVVYFSQALLFASLLFAFLG